MFIWKCRRRGREKQKGTEKIKAGGKIEEIYTSSCEQSMSSRSLSLFSSRFILCTNTFLFSINKSCSFFSLLLHFVHLTLSVFPKIRGGNLFFLEGKGEEDRDKPKQNKSGGKWKRKIAKGKGATTNSEVLEGHAVAARFPGSHPLVTKPGSPWMRDG